MDRIARRFMVDTYLPRKRSDRSDSATLRKVNRGRNAIMPGDWSAVGGVGLGEILESFKSKTGPT